MTYQHYSPEFKAKIVLQVLQGEKELSEVAKEHNINPNLGQGDGSLVPVFLLTTRLNCDKVRTGDDYAEICKASK